MADSVSRPRRGGHRAAAPRRGRSVAGTVSAFLLAACGALGALAGCGDSPGTSPTTAARPGIPPRRIISLAPSHTELLFALGAGDAVVGVTRYCDRPEEARSRPAVGDAVRIAQETVASLRPDLVITNARATVEALGPLRSRLRVLEVPTDTLDDLLRAVVTVGRAVDREEEARVLRASMDADIEAARERARARGGAGERVLVVVQRDPFFVAGPGSYVDSLLEVLGHRNAAASLEEPWPTISAEALLSLAPDVVVDASPNAPEDSDADAETLSYWSRFSTLPAVATGRVRRLTGDAAVRPGPALREALETLEASIAAAPVVHGGKGR